MATYNIDLPEASELSFNRTEPDGTKVRVLTAELVHLDAILTSAQISARKMRSNPDDRLWWLAQFTTMMNSHFHLTLTQTECHTIAVTVGRLGEQIKKNIEHIAKSLVSMESTPSASPPTNLKDSTSTSDESKPAENSMPGWDTTP